MEMQGAADLGPSDISLCDTDECTKRLSKALCFSTLPTHGNRSDTDHASQGAARPHSITNSPPPPDS